MNSLIDSIKINTQSSIRIQASVILYLDPFQIDEERHDADIVLITHAHSDHFDINSLKNVRKEDTTFIVPLSMKQEVIDSDIKEENLVCVNIGDCLEIKNIGMKIVPAYNIGKPMHPENNKWCGYILTIDGHTIYDVGDSDVIPEMDSIHCDVILIPIGGTFTMDENEAAELVNRMKPSYAIPIHYGTIINDPEAGRRFAEMVNAPTKVVFKLFS